MTPLATATQPSLVKTVIVSENDIAYIKQEFDENIVEEPVVTQVILSETDKLYYTQIGFRQSAAQIQGDPLKIYKIGIGLLVDKIRHSLHKNSRICIKVYNGNNPSSLPILLTLTA